MDEEVVFLGAEPENIRTARPRKRKAPSSGVVDLSAAAGQASTSAAAAAGLAAVARAAGGAAGGPDTKALALEDDAAAEQQPKQGRKKKQKVPKEPKPPKTPKEKRLARYRSQPSQQTQDRIARTMPGSGHRMFVIDSIPGNGTGLDRSHKFVILGATGNAYDVTIARQPQCTCPDFLKGNLCKHILFVNLRVLKLARDDPLVWQSALLSTEVESMLSGARSQGAFNLQDVVAAEAVRRAYSARAKGAAGQGDGAGTEAGRRPIDGEDCPICYDELKAVGEALVWCTTCGNNMHAACFGKWAQAKRSSGTQVTCVCCRTPWPDNKGKDAGDYVNLADVSTEHAHTSLRSLYGDNAFWIQRNQGLISTRDAARLWRGARH